MKLKKAKIVLEKINTLFSGISDRPGKVSAMERDLLLNYLRDMYDMVLDGDSEETKDAATLQYQALLKEKEEAMRKLEKAMAEAEKKAETERELRKAAERKADEEREKKKSDEEAELLIARQKEEEKRTKQAAEKELLEQARIKAIEDARKRAELEARLKLEEELRMKAAAVEAEVSNPTPKVEPVSVSTPDFSEEMEELFEEEEKKELSQKIGLRAIKNIKKAISINDRLLFINELFNKDPGALEQTVEILNDLENFQHARLYLEQKIVNQYNWLAKKRKRRAMEFIDVVRRRFL